MLNLLKYEFRKSGGIKAILLIITAVFQIVFMIGLFGDFEAPMAIGASSLMLIAWIGIGIIGIYSILTLHKDMNTKQGYMLFMIPKDSYRILGAKVIECGLSIWIMGAFFGALGLLDLSLLLKEFNEIDQIFDLLKMVIESVSELELNAGFAMTLVLFILTSWLFTVVNAYFAIVLSASFFNGKKFNWLISLAIFIAISLFISYIYNKLPIAEISAMKVSTNLLSIGFYLIPTVLLYFITAWIMDNKLSV
ncbi:MAG: hypothetical protein K6A38_11140 [Lachnospiraceae bacterium]|nr:hypothetical protein [Lachnospiraceae bacterium]